MTGGVTLACRQVVPEGMEHLVEAAPMMGPGAVMIIYCASAISRTPAAGGLWSPIGQTETLLEEPQIIGASCEGEATEAQAADIATRVLINSWGRTYDRSDMRFVMNTPTTIIANDYLPPKTVVPWAMIASTTNADLMPWEPVSYLLPSAMRTLPPDTVTEGDLLAIPFKENPPTTEVAHTRVPAAFVDAYPWVFRSGPRPDLNHPVADLCEISERINLLGTLRPENRHWKLCRRRAEETTEASDARISDLWVGTSRRSDVPKHLYVAEWDVMAGPLVAREKTPLDDILESAHASTDDTAILIAKRMSENGNCAYFPNIRPAGTK